MAKQSRANYQSGVDISHADNAVGDISAADGRGAYKDLSDSSVSRLDDAMPRYALTGGSATAYTVTLDYPDSYETGFSIIVRAHTTNTGADPTINITPSGGSALGAKTIKNNNGNSLSTGDLDVDNFYIMAYDGTDFRLFSGLNGLFNIVEDTSPQLGGNLDTNGFTIDSRDISTDGTKLDGIESGADVTDSTNVNSAGAVMNSDTTTSSMSFVIDEDDMASDSSTTVPTQQSVKAYVDERTKYKVVDIGDWNMDSTSTVSVAHGLSVADIRSVSGMIRADGSPTTRTPIQMGNTGTNYDVEVSQLNSTNVVLKRLTGGAFDSTTYNATSYNRGWIYIEYV